MPSLREQTESTFTLAAIIVELNEETLHSTFETLDLLQKIMNLAYVTIMSLSTLQP